MKIHHKIIAGFLAIALLVGLAGTFALIAGNRIIRSFSGGEEHFKVICSTAMALLEDVSEAEIHLMLFLAVHDAADHEKLRRRHDAIDAKTALLKDHVRLPEARRILDRIIAETEKLLALQRSLLVTNDKNVSGGEAFLFEENGETLRRMQGSTEAVLNNILKLLRIETGTHERQAAIVTATEASSHAKHAVSHILYYLVLHNPEDRGFFFKEQASLDSRTDYLDEWMTSSEDRERIASLKVSAVSLMENGVSLLRAYDGEKSPGRRALSGIYKDYIGKLIAIQHGIGLMAGGIVERNLALADLGRETSVMNALSLQRSALVLFAAAVIISLLLGYRISRTISAPLVRLRDAVTDIGRRNFDAAIDVSSRDEVGDLARSFSLMTRELKASTDGLISAKEELEQRVRERTTELEDLNERLTADIEQRQGVERDLRESEAKYRIVAERYRIVADNTYDWEFWIGPDGRFIYSSPSCKRITGHDADAFVTDPGLLMSIIHPDDKVAFEHHRQSAELRMTFDETVFRIVKPDGAIRRIGHVCQPVFDHGGAFLGTRGNNRDITDRMLAEEALRESENRFRMLVENLPQKIFLKDCRSVYVYCNNSYASDLGLTPERIVGKTDRDLYPPSSAEKHIAEDRAIIASGKPVEVVERYWKDSKEMIIRVFKIPIRDEAGTIRGLLGMIWDVTESVRLESIAEAVNTMDNIGYVFSGIRHEIGNPVNSLKITLGVLRNRIDGFTKEDITEYINRCMSEISRIEYLLKALRNFNMYEVPEIREVGMNAFMERFVALVSDDCGSRGIRVKSSVAPDVDRAYADPRALQQVLLNIVSNAMDAVDGRDDPVIEFAVTKMEDMIKIRVVDNGRGMSEQQQRDLFKPFRTTKERGTGLGLVIARKMTAKMNGAINVVSHYGEGTIVDILIPENKE